MKTTSIILSTPVSQKYEYEATRFSHSSQSLVIAPLTLTLPKNTKTASVSNLLSASILSAAKGKPPLPKSYDVRTLLTGDMTAVLNQGKCGSCWAFSSATAASDVLTLAQRKMKGKSVVPRVGISPMSFMYISGNQSHNMGCSGGNPLSTLQYILKNDRQLVLNECNDYSWYVNALSTGTKDTELNASWITNAPNIGQNGPLSLAETDTAQMGCFEDAAKGEHYQFSLGESVMVPAHGYVTDVEDIVLTFSDQTPDQIYNNGNVDNNIAQLAISNQKMMKRHLIETGSFMIGISVFNGFMSGGGELTNPAISQSLGGTEQINKSWLVDAELPDGNVYIQDSTDLTWGGGHALTVVGYGSHPKVGDRAKSALDGWYKEQGAGQTISDAIKKLGGDLGSYWIVRNSWSEKWPHFSHEEQNKKLLGYFCLAMYPANCLVQIAHPFHMSTATPQQPVTGKDSIWYNDLLTVNPKFGLFSLFVGLSAGDVCGGEDDKDKCETPLKTIPKNIRQSLFDKLDVIRDNETPLLTDRLSKSQLEEWSGQLLPDNTTVYTTPVSTHATGKPTNNIVPPPPTPGPPKPGPPTPPTPPTPGHTPPPTPPTHSSGISNTAIIIIIASAFILLSIVAFWLIRRGRRK